MIENPATGFEEPHVFEYFECWRARAPASQPCAGNSVAPSHHGHCENCRSRGNMKPFNRARNGLTEEQAYQETVDRIFDLRAAGFICHTRWSCEDRNRRECVRGPNLPNHPEIIDNARTEAQILDAVLRGDVHGLIECSVRASPELAQRYADAPPVTSSRASASLLLDDRGGARARLLDDLQKDAHFEAASRRSHVVLRDRQRLFAQTLSAARQQRAHRAAVADVGSSTRFDTTRLPSLRHRTSV